MAEFAPLFPLETQFQAKDGRNNTAGWLKVFLAGTDDPAVTYSDYNGTRNPEKIVLDNNGRAIIICDKEQGYRLEVYDARGMLLWTEEPVFCSGTGGAGMAMTEIVSTDGSIDVQKNTAGGVIQYDIGLAPGDSPEFLEWSTGFRGNMTYGSAKVPYYSAGTMSFDQYGVMVYKDRYYHITNKFFIKPLGTGTNYETFEVALMLRNPADGTAISIEIRKWDIDTSLTDEVQVEMSFDLTPSQDGELYWEFYNSLPKFQSTDAWIQIHRVYSGINAVPDTCATKQWISASYQPKSGMSSYVPYSAIGHDGDGAISGINGSAIAGQGVSPVTYVTTANTVYDVSNILASGGNPVFVDSLGVDKGLYVLVENWDSENGFKTFGRIEHNGLYSYSTFWSVNVDGWENTSYVINDVQADWSAVAINSPAYIKNKPDLSQYQTTADMSGYLPNSASGEFYPYSGNPSGFLTSHQDISTKLDVTAFTSYSANLDSALGDEFDQISSAFDNVQSALDNKLDKSASADLIAYSALEYSGGQITGISGSAIGGQIDTADFLPASASGDFYPMTGNPSGFLTAHQDISNKLDTSAFTGYTATALTGLENDVSSISAAVSGITGLTGTYVEQSAFNDYSADIDSAKQDTLTFAYDSDSAISSINGSALAGNGGGVTGNYISATGLDQAISNPAGTQAVSFASGDISGTARGTAAGLWITGQFGTAYYKDNELNLNRNNHKIAFNIGINGPKISAMASSKQLHAYMYLFQSGGNSGVYSESGISGNNSSNTNLWKYGHTEYTQLTSVYDTVSGNSANWGGIDSATCSAIASSYAESAASSKLDSSASSNFYTTANESGYITTADLADYATTAYVDSSVSGKADTTALTGYQPTGDYAYNSSLSSKLDESAFSTVSGSFLTAVPAGYATEAYVDSSVSGKQDTLTFGYENYDITSINGSAVGGAGGGEPFRTAVYSADTAMRSGHDTEFKVIYTPSAVSSTVYPTADTLLSGSGNGHLDYFLAEHDTGGSPDWYTPIGSGLIYNLSVPVYISASGSDIAHDTVDKVTARALTGYEANIVDGAYKGSGYLLNNGIILNKTYYDGNLWSASGSGTMADLSNTYTGTATFAISKWTYNSSHDYLGGAVSYAGSAGATAVVVEEFCVVPDVSNKLDKTAQVVTSTSTGNYTMGGFTVVGVSGINTKALLAVSAGSAQCDSNGNTITATYQTTAGMTAYQPTGDYAYNSALSGKLDESAFSSVSGTFLTAVPADYATTAYVDSSVSGKQDISGMTAYQPVGAYIYESALGWAEV